MKKEKTTQDSEIRAGICVRENDEVFVRVGGGKNGAVYISDEKLNGAKLGDRVAVRITRPALYGRRAKGEVTAVAGHKDDPGADVLSVVMAHDMPYEFPPEVLEVSEKIAETVKKTDIKNRTDYREQAAVTIDGADAKDLDDAVFLEQNGDGWRLYVHIADVARYVPQGGALDKEAFRRGTSAYLADRVIPMLPRKLSNGICSLNAGEDRLALTCVMEINSKGWVIDSKIQESVINVKERLTYDYVSEVLEGGTGSDMILEMGRLAELLRSVRMKRGALELTSSECKFTVDNDGRPVSVTRQVPNAATSVIEEFMLLCNETVARTLSGLAVGVPFRVHEPPDAEKTERFINLMKSLGFKEKKASTAKNTKNSKRGAKKAKAAVLSSKAFNAILSKASGTRYEQIAGRAALSSMKQARYAAENIGHYGLASACYCHFTSPIRRYPDLYVHRVIKAYLKNGAEGLEKYRAAKGLPEKCALMSAYERRAVDVEREVESMKKIQYMEDKVGRVFDGVISGVKRWGLYVELTDTTVEGLVNLRNMHDDYYVVDEERWTASGERTGKTYRMGDPVRVAAVYANAEERRLDFVLVTV